MPAHEVLTDRQLPGEGVGPGRTVRVVASTGGDYFTTRSLVQTPPETAEVFSD